MNKEKALKMLDSVRAIVERLPDGLCLLSIETGVATPYGDESTLMHVWGGTDADLFYELADGAEVLQSDFGEYSTALTFFENGIVVMKLLEREVIEDDANAD